jgi:hypothetical protein
MMQPAWAWQESAACWLAALAWTNYSCLSALSSHNKQQCMGDCSGSCIKARKGCCLSVSPSHAAGAALQWVTGWSGTIVVSLPAIPLTNLIKALEKQSGHLRELLMCPCQREMCMYQHSCPPPFAPCSPLRLTLGATRSLCLVTPPPPALCTGRRSCVPHPVGQTPSPLTCSACGARSGQAWAQWAWSRADPCQVGRGILCVDTWWGVCVAGGGGLSGCGSLAAGDWQCDVLGKVGVRGASCSMDEHSCSWDISRVILAVVVGKEG